MPARARLIVLVLALAAGGCPRGEVGAPCIADSECDEASRLGCWLGTCQRFAKPAGSFAFEVIPMASLGLGPSAFAPDSIDRLEFRLCPRSEITGEVELPAGFPLDIVATAATAVPGLQRRQTFLFPAEPGTGRRRSFILALPPASWRLRFTSRDGESPPLSADVEVPPCAAVKRLDVAAPGPLREIPLRFGPGPLGRCGAVVQAFDQTGEPLSAVVESAGDGETCPDRVLRLHVEQIDDVLPLVLRIRPVAGPPAVPSRDLYIHSYPGADGICPPDATPPCDAVATIDLLPPDGDEPTYLAPVMVEVQDDAGFPVNAVERVVAAGLLDGLPVACDPSDRTRCGWGGPGGPALFVVREEGPGSSLVLPLLLPGRYGFTVVPVPGPFAITTVEAAPVLAEETVPLRLTRKPSVRGTVTFEGRPLRSLVRAEPTGRNGRPAWIETGDDGRYELPLDPGMYRLVAQPKEATRYAPWGSRDLPETWAGGTYNVVVPSRARVMGRLLGQGVGEAVVRAFQCRPDCKSAGAVAIPVGTTVADDDGSFALLVPGS